MALGGKTRSGCWEVEGSAISEPDVSIALRFLGGASLPGAFRVCIFVIDAFNANQYLPRYFDCGTRTADLIRRAISGA